MAVKYALQQKGVSDGSVPAGKADGRQVSAKKRVILASKDPGEAWNSGDTVCLGLKHAGEKLIGVDGTTDTSFGTATLSIGTAASPTKYVGTKTLTATDTPTSLGPKASTLDDAPGGEEMLWLTIGTANIGAAVLATIALELCSV